MPYPDSGVGGGGGFRLGPAQNVFTGATRAAAESARDTYATANPAWLASYNADISLNIRLEFSESSDDVVQYQARNAAGNAWLDNESFRGVQGRPGMDGMGSLDQNIPAGTILQAVDDNGNIVPGISSLMDTGTEVQSNRRIMAPDGGGIRLGGTTFYNAANGVAAQTADGDIFYPVASRFDPATGTSQPFYLDVDAPQDLPVQAASGETITSGNIQFSFASTNTGIAVQYRLISAKATETTDVNITFELNNHGSGDVIFDWRRATGGTGATFPAGDGTTEFTLDLPLPAGLVFEEDDRIFITIAPPAGETVSVRGGDFTDDLGTQNNFPFVTAHGLTGSTVPIITQNQLGTDAGDVVQLDSQGRLPAVNGSQLTNLPAVRQINDEDVDVGDEGKTGLLTGSSNVETALNRIDNTGLGAAPRSFTGSFFASYGANGNQGQWYGGRANVTMIGARGQSNGNYTYQLPDIDELNAMFDDQVSRGLGEVYQITVGYLGGNTQSVVRNSMTVRPPSVSALFDRNELPTTIAQGSEVTFRIERIGGNIGQWERIGVSQSVDPVATFGEVVLQNTPWNNADSSFLPSASAVQKGYAFPVFGSNPNDGTLRQGLLDAGVSDRLIYDGDYVVWTADAFTNWTDGDSWFVLSRNDLQRMSREQSNFLAQSSEVDNKVDVALATMAGADAVVWLSENPLAEAPFINPSTDSNNPRAGDDYPYIGGRENRDAMQRFTFGQNRFNSYLTVGISPAFILGHPESTIDIVLRDTDGVITQRLNLATDFTLRDDATFTNSTYRHYVRNTSFSYPFLNTIEIWLTQVQEHFTLNSQTVNLTPNIRDLPENQLSAGVIEKLNRALPDPGVTYSSIEDRLMRRGQITVNTPDHLARFRSSSATDAYPQQLSDFNQVSVDNPRWQATDVVLFVATPEPGLFVLTNTSTNTPIPLADFTPNVDVIESFTDSGTTYFVWKITGITVGNRFEVTRTTIEGIIVERNDISNLQEDVQRIDAELEHAALNLPAAVVDILDNELTVTEESTPTVVSSDYNNGLGNTGSQTVFFESSPIAPSAGQKRSNAFNLNTGDRAGRKLAYIDAGATYGNSVILSSSTGTDLMHYQDGSFLVNVFVPAIPASTTTQTVYPAPSNQVSGPGIWHRVPTVTFVNGVPVPEANELFYTRNNPDTPTTLTIQFRGHANGNVFGLGTVTLSGVGGTSQVSTTFVLDDGSERATVEVRYYPNFQGRGREIRASVIESVRTGLPTINDIEVILSYTETRTVPATNSRVKQVDIEHANDGAQVFAFKPSAANTLIIVGDRLEIDTNRAYTDLFGADQSGWLVLFNDMAEFYDYEDFEPIATTVADLENHASLPQRGLFTTQYTRETELNIGVTIKPQGINVGDLPTASTGLAAGDLWNDSGTLRIV